MKRQLMIEMKMNLRFGYSFRLMETVLTLAITVCVLIGCKGTSSLLEIAAETEENYKLNDEERALVRNGNDFAVKLFGKIAEEEGKKDVFVSTIGVFYSLNIINNGASGRTQQEICSALDIAPADVGRINRLCRRLMIGQVKVNEDEFQDSSSYMRIATLFQAGKRVDIRNSFQNVLEDNYFADVVTGNLNSALQEEVNCWCAEQTEGLLSSFPLRQIDDDSGCLLVANYFNGRWVQSFDSERTKEEPFYGGTRSKVNMMNMTEEDRVFSYAKLDSFSLLRIPYVGGYKLYVFLPDKVDGLAALLQSLDGEKVKSAISQVKFYNRMHTKIPKFHIKYSFNANKYLRALGVSRMFGNASELDGIQSEPMKIKDILQETNVIMDEDGTRAGAVTSASSVTLGKTMNPTEAYFYADHPFAYIIQDPFGSYCFIGTFWGSSE